MIRFLGFSVQLMKLVLNNDEPTKLAMMLLSEEIAMDAIGYTLTSEI
jgi:hypothetical protein